MADIVVAGGGIAGVAAAIKASSLGSRVMLLEESETIGQPKSLFPYLLSGELRPDELKPINPGELETEFGIENRLKEKVVSVDTKRRILETDISKVRYDALVLATGSSSMVDAMKGVTKKGVYAMKGVQDYEALSKELRAISSVGILGSTPLAITAAEILTKRKVKVTLFAPSLLLGYFSPVIRDVLLHRLRTNGVNVVDAGIDQVAGMVKVEAAVSGGSVYPCEALAIFPRMVPRVPRIEVRKGVSGGVLVDKTMKTSEHALFAAGDCAELMTGSSSFPVRLQAASRVMGEVAGANASGASEVARISGALGLTIFGLEICSAGLTLEGATKAGFDAAESGFSGKATDEVFDGDSISCSIVYGRISREVYGIQLAGWRALSYSDFASLAVSMNIRLSDLAHLESGYVPKVSRDESPIATTAKKAVSTAG